jgi:hypothetical protein|tara:strand:+ start:494 stop:670 length:177 start_codon:yes stop_codon:yes gene_type:complete
MSSMSKNNRESIKDLDLSEIDTEYDESTNQKTKQQDMTELNGDGNRERGRNGEDLKNN